MSNGGQHFREPGDWFTPQFRWLIQAMMKRDGRDFGYCEVGRHEIEGRWCLFHEKYEGATYYDLRISCYPCNLKPEYVGLK